MAPPKPKPKAKPKATKKQISVPSQGKEPKSSAKESTASLPLELQQLLLNIFKNAFSVRLQTDIKPLLQEVKGHLYNRDFLTAFGKNEYLEAYAARWSPSRALGYLQVYDGLKEHIVPPLTVPPDDLDKSWQVVCLGGGAGAEIVALAGLRRLLKVPTEGEQLTPKMDIMAIDIANWSHIVDKLSENITSSPPLSKYASSAAKAANSPLLEPEHFSVTFHQHDILNTAPMNMTPLLESAKLVTLMFTLNELYSTSLSMTQKFLLTLTASLTPGSYFLVVDSPGSYSTVTLNGAEKKYPMQWLLDHTLLKTSDRGKDGDEDGAKWEKVREEESTWFRLDEASQYPIDLENMRYQLHLYRRV